MLRFTTKETAAQIVSTTSKSKKKGIFDVSVIKHREHIAKAEPFAKPAEVQFIDMAVPISQNARIPIRIYLPSIEQKGMFLPTLFYIPGTAFVAHESKFTQVICSHICQRANCQIIVINHRLAPENSSPTSYLDSYEVFKFFMENKRIVPIDRNRVALVGYSSGGNIAALMAIKAKQEGIKLMMQVLISPIVDLSRQLNDFQEFERKDRDISEQFVNWFLDLYLSDNINADDPRISPIWETRDKLRGLPPTAIIVAEYDRFRSDAEAYYKKLLDAGVSTKKICVDKENHSYLWHRLEIVEKIADNILKPAFHGESINSIPSKHTLSYITPNMKIGSSEEKNKNETKESTVGKKLVQAKL